MEIVGRNVNEVFHQLVRGIHLGYLPTEARASRNGEVQQIEEVLTVKYTQPSQRVLFNPYRDASPFLHLYESLYFLAGRRDVTPLAYYSSKIAQYSDDGEVFNGGYGYRWRNMPYNRPEEENLDQLELIIQHLKNNPHSRRAVLQMWEVEQDLLQIGQCEPPGYQPSTYSKDVCCNLSVVFGVSLGPCPNCDGSSCYVCKGNWTAKRAKELDEYQPPAGCPNCGGNPGMPYMGCPKCKGLSNDQPHSLNMMVFNRSNDLILGLTGANACHFSVLLEYVAAHLGLKVGVYNHVTANGHIYSDNWKPLLWLKDYEQGGTQSHKWYDSQVRMVPLVKDPAVFDRELPIFVEQFSGKLPPEKLARNWQEPFLATVAQPMLIAFACHKVRDYHGAFAGVNEIEADDWKVAARGWIERRHQNWQRKQERESYHGGQEEGVI